MFDLDGYDFSLKNVVTNINDYNKASSILEKEGNHSFNNDGFPVDIYTSGLKNLHQKKILVIFSGAISKRENKSAPFFSGKNIAKTLDLPLIAISDPTLALSKSLSLSWYAGNEYFKNISVVINNLLKNIQNKYDTELLLVGGSGGGFAVLNQLSLFGQPSKKIKALHHFSNSVNHEAQMIGSSNVSINRFVIANKIIIGRVNWKCQRWLIVLFRLGR